MMETSGDSSQPKHKGIVFYLYCAVMLVLLVGNFLTWRQVEPAKRELRKTQRFLDQQLNTTRLRSTEKTNRSEVSANIKAYLSNGMEADLIDVLAKSDSSLFYAVESKTNAITLYSSDEDQSLVVEVLAFSPFDTDSDDGKQTFDLPLAANAMHTFQIDTQGEQFALRLNDKEISSRKMPGSTATATATGRVRVLSVPGILTQEQNVYSQVHQHRKWQSLLVRTFTYTRKSTREVAIISVSINVKTKGDLYVPPRFHEAAARTVRMKWDDQKMHYRIEGVLENAGM